ncbi:MAG: hypothetical protein EXR46_00595 [Dehalococcoidia bacterium]|nr:hypothetical protein [Dehalococcoidia bacterium]
MPGITPDLSHLSVVGIFAHPDDEGFGCGGTLALLAARGARLTLVCATNGDVGQISDPSLATPETLAQVRQEELRQAAAVTGVQDLRFLNYRDSGMVGSRHNQHLASLHQASPARVVGRLAGILREVRPQVVLTHDSTGGYGHPDHLAVYRHVTSAVALAGDAAAYPEQAPAGLTPWIVPLLYYVCFPRTQFRRMWHEMLTLGITPPFASKDAESLGCPDDEVTTTLNVRGFVDTKIASLNCHRTQLDPNGPFARFSPELMREIMSTEYFALARRDGASGEADLLAGLW